MELKDNMKKLVNGIEMDMTSQEIAQREADIQQFNNNEFNLSIENLRQKRNELLANSDWEVIMAKEKGTTLSAGFKTYRQDLRDITEGLTTVAQVEAVVFPTKP
nr:hypothetical protein [uncultured Mediterranean phage uvMED]